MYFWVNDEFFKGLKKKHFMTPDSWHLITKNMPYKKKAKKYFISKDSRSYSIPRNKDDSFYETNYTICFAFWWASRKPIYQFAFRINVCLFTVCFSIYLCIFLINFEQRSSLVSELFVFSGDSWITLTFLFSVNKKNNKRLLIYFFNLETEKN